MTAAGRKYLKEVRKRVLSQGDERTRFLNTMENRTMEYVQCNPDATVKELCEKLGDLDAIEQQQVEDCPRKKLFVLAQGGRIALKGLVFLLLIGFLAIALTIVCLVIDNNNARNGYEIDAITIFPD